MHQAKWNNTYQTPGILSPTPQQSWIANTNMADECNSFHIYIFGAVVNELEQSFLHYPFLTNNHKCAGEKSIAVAMWLWMPRTRDKT